jgi:anti-anti-sigma regulatory factor
MLEEFYPVQWAGGQAVVALPEHIGASNAGRVRDGLLSVINLGAVTLIADMSATVSCDHAGADAVVRAWRRATVSGTELRLVVTDQNVSRVLGLRGLDRRVSAYPSLEAATAARLPAAAVLAAATPRPAGQRPNGNGAAGLPGGLLEPLQDAVALADGDGMITAASREHLRLLDAVVTGLFHAGLGLQAAEGLPADAARQRTREVAGELDDIIGQIRAAMFAGEAGGPGS